MASSKNEAWQRLVNGKSLTDLPLQQKGGRIDLGGLVLTQPRVLRRTQTSLAQLNWTEPINIFRSAKLQDLDLTGSTLPLLHFTKCEISNCCFDRCDMRGLRLCGTTVRNSSFRAAKLRGNALGAATVTGPFAGMRNRFLEVDFSAADLRDTTYVAADFRGCDFSDAELANIIFGTSTFSGCRFAGELRQVQFWRSDLFTRGFPDDAFPPNEMANIDFSRATLRDVEFRGLTLDRVRFPEGADHFVVEDFPNALDRLITALTQQGDETARLLVAFLSVCRKWTVPNAKGVLNKKDLAEAGTDAVTRVGQLLRQFGFNAEGTPKVSHN